MPQRSKGGSRARAAAPATGRRGAGAVPAGSPAGGSPGGGSPGGGSPGGGSPGGGSPGGGSIALTDRPLVERAITRSLSDQYAAAAQDVARIIEATYLVIEREGTVDPRIRDILEEAGLATQAFYRHFKSKDELLLVLLDDGRRRLAEYLVHRMSKAGDPVGQVRAWIEGILAQASDASASARTRPFILGLQRLAEQYPEEQAASVAVLVELLEGAIVEGVALGQLDSAAPGFDAQAIYHLNVSVMEGHVLMGTKPSKQETEHLVGFSLRGLGAS